jgi:hypothetical protein
VAMVNMKFLLDVPTLAARVRDRCAVPHA